jgi:hypothetical protein
MMKKIMAELEEFFTDDECSMWFITEKAELGGVAPLTLMTNGEGDKVLKFIEEAKEEAWRELTKRR